MFLRKIVDLILYNQQIKLSENKKDYVTEVSDTAGNRINEDCIDTASLGGETSVLDFCFSSQVNSVDPTCTSRNNERNVSTVSTNYHDEKCLFSSSEGKGEKLQILKAKTPEPIKPNCNSFGNKEILSTEGQLTSGFIGVDNQTSCTDGIKEMCKIMTKPDFTLTDSSQLMFFHKMQCHNTSDVKWSRNICTQTESNLDKRRHSSITKYPCKHAHIQQIPELEKKSGSFPICGTRTHNLSFFPVRENLEEGLESVVYGTLLIFGCNRAVPSHLVGTMKSKFVLRKRIQGNGLKEAFSYVRSEGEPVFINPTKHVISYSVSSKVCIDVAFQRDSTRDMFQIGRHDKPPIDFKVDDLNSPGEPRNCVSRFACRILVRRDGNHEARVYAAAFDSSQTIFLGEESIPCTYRSEMDAFTTNGILIMQPKENYPGMWREVSVGGYVYPLRKFSKVEASKRPRLIEESNVLQDGTLIDLCGATLVWRTPEGLKNTPNEEYLNRLQFTLHRSVPECQLVTHDSNLFPELAVKKAYVYLSCGHVIGFKNLPKRRSCPICRVISPVTELMIGAEPGFYMSREFPSYAFKPCGHVASVQTVKYWSSLKIPIYRSTQDSHCPFCGVKLNYFSKYVKLIFPGE